MSLIPIFHKELEQEALITRKMLSRVPDDKFDWQPHPRSMTIRSLATHIAELPTWIPMVIDSHELDFASTPYMPAQINSTAELMDYFERSLEEGRVALSRGREEEMDQTWTLRNGEDIYADSTKHDFIRVTYNQITHHRAQLGVYLRLLDIPIPGSYGPSADEH